MPIPQQPQMSSTSMRPGSGEPDDGPLPQASAPAGMSPAAPQEPAPDQSVNNDGSQPAGNPDTNPDSQYQQKLAALPDADKQFIVQMTTPETAKYVALVTGDQDLGNFLAKNSDNSRVLVPVPRDKAMAYLQSQQNQQGDTQSPAPQNPQAAPQGAPAGQPQGQPQPAPQQPAAPNMKPQPMPQMPQQPLPNGVTPAPMQHGIMAPH